MKITNLILFFSLMLLMISCKKADRFTARGYEYILHTQNEGPKPQPGEYAYFHITMVYDDSVINTSYTMDQLPRLRIPLQEEYTPNTPVIIDGLREMSQGDSLSLFFPLDSLESRPPAYAEMDIIEYRMKLLEIKTDAAFKEEMKELMTRREEEKKIVKAREPEISSLAQEILSDFKSGKLKKEMLRTTSGLQYIVHEKGNGDLALPGNRVSVHYYGMLMNGLMFDNSFKEGEPFQFILGQGAVIRGWDEGLTFLSQGAKASFFIPPDMGYGAAGYGSIPGDADLYFYVELDKLN
jgi:FKBP-type peptidyl-prolyl cis-trans isomerase FkpA